MSGQKGLIHLLPLMLGVVIIGAAIFAFIQGWIKLPSVSSPFQKSASVDLKTTYKNPFDKETQYVNPFQTYKNPFVVNR